MTDTASTKVIELIRPLVEPLGYEIVHIEVQNHRQKLLRVFIDRLDGAGVGVEDCARVSRALDEPLEQMTEIDALFKGAYELEVSSPGVDRPLRQPKDFTRFAGKEARIHVYRPLTATELGDEGYQQKNPKQKNFLGVLQGLRGESVLLSLESPAEAKPRKKNGKAESVRDPVVVTIPLPLIAKANLEPRFDDSLFEKES
jgi:ribosome maturation factor RimP